MVTLTLRSMFSLLGAFGLLLLSAAAPAHALAPSAFEPSDAQKKKLQNDEILTKVTQDDTINTWVVAVVDAPVNAVWKVIDDFEDQKQWMPDTLEGSHEFIRDEGKYRICKTGTDLPWPLANRVYKMKMHNRRATVDGTEGYVSSWSYIEDSGNIESMEGYWLVIPWGEDGEQTLVKQVTRVDLGVSVPGALIRSGTRNKLPKIMKALRERVAAVGEK